MKTIYFAGSVGKSDWRNDLAMESNGRIMSKGKSVYTGIHGGSFIYGGPFAISCDHGCFHVYGDHGSTGESSFLNCHGSIDFEDKHGGYTKGDKRHIVFNRCMLQIQECDVVLAHIKRVDCFGTYFELGFAHGIGKPIYIHVDRLLDIDMQKTYSEHANSSIGDELWFVKLSANVLDSLEIPRELLFFNNKTKYQIYLESPGWKQKAFRAREKAENRCQVCNRGDLTLNVHHRTYDNVYNEKPGDLIVLCKACHSKFHDIQDDTL